MSRVKITQLQEALTTEDGGTEIFLVVQNGVSKHVSLATLLANIKADVEINKSLGSIDFVINGSAFASLLKTVSATNRIGIGTGDPKSLLHVNGDFRVGDENVNGRIIQSHETITISGEAGDVYAINIGYGVSFLKTIETSISSKTITIPNPNEKAQEKTIIFSEAHAAKSSGLNYTVTGSFLGCTAIKFAKLGDSAQLKSCNGSWAVVGYNGATLI
jgi:hypothetical protein